MSEELDFFSTGVILQDYLNSNLCCFISRILD